MNKIITSLMIVGLLASCRGRDANPVQVIQSRDYELSCTQLKFELNGINDHMQDLLKERTNSNAANAGAVAGAILFFPALFFLDFSKAEKVEIEAYQSRAKHLSRVGKEKRCADLPEVKVQSEEEKSIESEGLDKARRM